MGRKSKYASWRQTTPCTAFTNQQQQKQIGRHPSVRTGALERYKIDRMCMTMYLTTAMLVGVTSGLAHATILTPKRGIAGGGSGYSDLQATAAGWYYNWGPTPSNAGNFNANFYPMFWEAPSQAIINQVVATNPLYVLGFNEPDNPTQSNMTVSQAITSWKMIAWLGASQNIG